MAHPRMPAGSVRNGRLDAVTPLSDVAPAWLDGGNAGERWDEDEQPGGTGHAYERPDITWTDYQGTTRTAPFVELRQWGQMCAVEVGGRVHEVPIDQVHRQCECGNVVSLCHPDA